MRAVLSTPLGSELYKQHGQLTEPIFGHTKHNRGFTRFARRGRSAARTEWRLIATTHNLVSSTSTSPLRSHDPGGPADRTRSQTVDALLTS
jgi:hypothetical protein